MKQGNLNHDYFYKILCAAPFKTRFLSSQLERLSSIVTNKDFLSLTIIKMNLLYELLSIF